MKLEPVSLAELATHWGLSDRRIRQFEEEGVAVRSGRGFDLRESDRRYIAKLKDQSAAREARRRAHDQQSRLRAVRLARESRQLVTVKEMIEFHEELWGMVWQTFTMIGGYLFRCLPGSEMDRRMIAGDIDKLVKGDLLLLRERFKELATGEADRLSGDEHLARILAIVEGMSGPDGGRNE